jgi:hypothetical protein
VNCGLAFFAYSTNYLIDLKYAVIMEVEASVLPASFCVAIPTCPVWCRLATR